MKHSVADLWLAYMRQAGSAEAIRTRMPDDLPNILSVIGTRKCNLQCRHCIFPHDDSLPADSHALGIAVETISRQMPHGFALIHEGRTFSPEHLDWLRAVRQIRPDAYIGLIDNGSYVRHLPEILASGFRFDGLDISIDGPEAVHNRQRCSTTAFRNALTGIDAAHDILVANGSVSALTTLTGLNYDTLVATCDTLTQSIEAWHVTTVTPARPELMPLSVTAEQFKESWRQLKQISKHRPVTLKFYWTDDVPKLIEAVGRKVFDCAFSQAIADYSSVWFEIDGIEIRYFPHSIAPKETFVIDADACFRLPYANAYSLRELQSGISRFGKDFSPLTVGPIGPDNTLSKLYQECVRRWLDMHFEQAIAIEATIFQNQNEHERR
ncbi:MAG: radical SAM protein [Candidatus Moranbacteria bacterium]|nr:radical SAM protein [Candidatus Moranbacteria bacterium]